MSDGVVVVRVPASSANLGPGFDVLGMALTMHAEVGTGPPPAGAHVADDHHPATIAFRRAGGEGPVWTRSPIPMGRGLGYSGAMRVGGALAGVARRRGGSSEASAEVLAIASELEGHADNVAASLYGGVVVAAAGRALRVPVAVEPAVVTWSPDTTTSTEKSRAALEPVVRRDDAVFNLGRTALLVTALATGDVDALRDATADRLHQDVRLAAAPGSRAALDAGLAAGAWCGWLSGSGPTVALLCAPDDAERLAASLPDGARTRVLAIDGTGATLVDG